MKKLVTGTLLILSCISYGQTLMNTDSLLKLLPAAKEDSNKVLLLFKIGENFENSDPKKAKYYIGEGEALSIKINYETGIMKSYRMLSYVHAFQSEFDSVLYYNKMVLKMAKQKKDTFNIGVSMFNIGVAYRSLTNYDSAIQYTLDAVHLLEGKGYSNIEAGLFDGLQALYLGLLQYDKAIEYGEKSVSLSRKNKDPDNLITALNNVALSYVEVNRIPDAKKAYNEVIDLAVKTGNKSMEAMALNNLCDIAEREGEFEKIKPYAEKSLQLNEELENSYGIMSSRQALSVYYLYKKDYAKANANAFEALRICNKDSFPEAKAYVLESLSNISFAMGDFRNGFKYQNESSEIQSRIFTESIAQKEASMKVKYETVKKEILIKELEAEKKVQQLAIRQKKMQNYILIVAGATLLIISLLSYRTYLQKQKLQQQRISELETQQQLTATEAVLKGEEQERTRLAKDLHDGLGGMLSGIKYSFNTMKGNLVMTPDNAQAFERSMDMLDSSIKEMRRVAHNMMPEALVKFGLDTALKDFCNDINQSGALQVNYQSIGMEIAEIEQTAAITIYRIVQELINNTMKHAAAKTAIVQVSKTDGEISITVEDDGKGFNPVILQGGKGIGWSNIQSRVEYLKGKLDVQSEPGKGTSVHIELNT